LIKVVDAIARLQLPFGKALAQSYTEKLSVQLSFFHRLGYLGFLLQKKF
jgi:hypothetical protein